MAALCHSLVPQTRLFPSLFSPPKFFISCLPFQHSQLNHRLARLRISSPNYCASSTTAAPSTTAAAPNPTPISETFDWFSQWYPLIPVCDLDKQAPKALTVLGLEVVIWWDRNEGVWKVFDDRCPHRLAPLSEGRIDHRGRLQCVYHGWCFDGAGKCKYIPQAPALGPPVHKNERACVAVYPSIVQNHILWFWPNTSPQYKDIMHRTKPPYIPELDDQSFVHVMSARDVHYGYEILTENLLDPSHFPYTHYGIIHPKKHDDPGIETDREGGSPLKFTIQKSDISGVDAGFYKFIAPSVTYFSIFRDSPETSSKASGNEPRYLNIFLCIPVSPGNSRVITITTWNYATWIDKLLPRWYYHMTVNLVIDSDHHLLHVEERKLASEGNSNWHETCYLPTQSDALVVAFRSWLRKYSSNQVNWGIKDFSLLPTSPPREQLMDRYWSHVVHCKSCSGALRAMNAIKVSLQVLSIALIGIVTIANQSLTGKITKAVIIAFAVASAVVSHLLSQFIHKTFYYHDYSHAVYRTTPLLKRILGIFGIFSPSM